MTGIAKSLFFYGVCYATLILLGIDRFGAERCSNGSAKPGNQFLILITEV